MKSPQRRSRSEERLTSQMFSSSNPPSSAVFRESVSLKALARNTWNISLWAGAAPCSGCPCSRSMAGWSVSSSSKCAAQPQWNKITPSTSSTIANGTRPPVLTINKYRKLASNRLGNFYFKRYKGRTNILGRRLFMERTTIILTRKFLGFYC